jgi:hypothetical protein
VGIVIVQSVFKIISAERLAYRRAKDPEHTTEIGLHQDGKRISA